MHLAVIMLFAFSQYGTCSPVILFPYAMASVPLTACATEKPATSVLCACTADDTYLGIKPSYLKTRGVLY